MRNLQPPTWYEGMTLDPHHFQQWDRHHRHILDARSRAATPFDWGFLDLDIDENSLVNGQFEIRSCRGIMRDGYVFDCPTKDPLPPPQNFRDQFPPTAEKLSVFFALPAEQQNGRNLQLEGSSPNREVRFRVESVTLADETTGSNEREISICLPNFSIVFGDADNRQYSTLHIADIVRTSAGTYALSDIVIPPCLAISSSKSLMRRARHVLELLVAKADALSARRRQQASGQVEYSPENITLLGMLQTINKYIPVISHHHKQGAGHPELLYLAFASLAGELTTFSADQDIRPSEFPPYDHEHSAHCFAFLEDSIARLLELTTVSNYVKIVLEKQNENQWLARIGDPGLLASAQLYLGVSGEMAERKLVDELPHKIKIAAPSDLAPLVAAALPGLSVVFTSRPPMGLPSRPDLHYYKLEQAGRLWDSITRNNGLVLFVPLDFRGARFELYALRTN